jgi:pyruvate/2-oxoglutarate/acetoin dehydrogenase E1 component
VAARVADEGFDLLDAPVRRLTGAFVPTPYAPALEAAVVPDAAAVIGAIRALVAE